MLFAIKLKPVDVANGWYKMFDYRWFSLLFFMPAAGWEKCTSVYVLKLK